MGCVNCHNGEVEVSFNVPVISKQIRQVYNLCGSCASLTWSKFKHTQAFESIIVNTPYTAKEFKKLAEENNSDKFGSSWCEFFI
jgi:protein-arginine kinase activator protein McsA